VTSALVAGSVPPHPGARCSSRDVSSRDALLHAQQFFVTVTGMCRLLARRGGESTHRAREVHCFLE
jgi:hypothetical protein